nr:MAG: hypothetical protein [flactilig virus 18]
MEHSPPSKNKMVKKRTRPTKGKKAKSNDRPKNNPPMVRDAKGRAMSWLKLLGDPCSAQLVRPCYTGVDAGYLIRTTNIYKVSATAEAAPPGTIVPMRAFVQYTPWNMTQTTGIVAAASTATEAISIGTGLGNFISQSLSVAQYRPVACCLKWIPNGPYSTRQGSVGFISQPGRVIAPGETVNFLDHLARCPAVDSNGSTHHEVRWLPTAVDESFTTIAAPVNTGAGAVTVVLERVDGTYEGTGTSVQTVQANGRLEIVTVWEWTPDANQALVAITEPPLPYTAQQVLSTIRDMSSFVYRGVANGVYRTASAGSQMLLTAGVQGMMARQPALLRQ